MTVRTNVHTVHDTIKSNPEAGRRIMKRAQDQLLEETSYLHLASFLRCGGTLEIGEDSSLGAFARIRKGNTIIVVDAAYRDLAAILNEMDAKAREYFDQESGRLRKPENK